MALFQNKLFISVISVVALVFITTLIESRVANSSNDTLSEKKIISLLLNNLDVKLSNSQFCENTGTDFSDKTLADYLAGFWGYHTQQTGKNWIEVEAKSNSENDYLAKVMIYRKKDEENWGWGLSFKINKHTLSVNRKSFTCIGSG